MSLPCKTLDGLFRHFLSFSFQESLKGTVSHNGCKLHIFSKIRFNLSGVWHWLQELPNMVGLDFFEMMVV